MMNSTLSSAHDGSQYEHGGIGRYGRIFVDQMNCLYLLSFLVTADRKVAENCFAKALDEYMESRGGFLDWASKDGRLAVLRHAIQAIQPMPKQAYSWTLNQAACPTFAAPHQPFAMITSLSPFERFAFVMATIEGLPEEECARLLDCSLQEIVFARELARRIIAMGELPHDMTGDSDMLVVPTLLGDQRCGVC